MVSKSFTVDASGLGTPVVVVFDAFVLLLVVPLLELAAVWLGIELVPVDLVPVVLFVV